MPPKEPTPPVEITEPIAGVTPEVTEPTPTAPEPTALEAELADTRKALKKANREAADRRKQLEAFEKDKLERKQAAMSELEKAQTEIAELKAAKQDAEAARDLLEKRNQFYAAIGKADLQWANEQARQDAVMLVNLSEMDDEDIDGIVKELKETRPYLFASAAPAPDIDGKKRGKAPAGSGFDEQVEAAKRRYNIT